MRVDRSGSASVVFVCCVVFGFSHDVYVMFSWLSHIIVPKKTKKHDAFLLSHFLTNIDFLSHTIIFKAQYGLIVQQVPLNPNYQSFGCCHNVHCALCTGNVLRACTLMHLTCYRFSLFWMFVSTTEFPVFCPFSSKNWIRMLQTNWMKVVDLLNISVFR